MTGFEPQREAYQALNARKTDLETYLPYAVGDGAWSNFHICAYPGFSSLLKPCAKALAVFSEFTENARVLEIDRIQTRRLDDIQEVAEFDFLKIDVQGSELVIFENALNHLVNVVAIQLEVSFVSLYENQPTFGVLDTFLRGLGFMPHTLVALKNWKVGPLVQPVNYFYKQILEADALYVKDLVSPMLSNEQLKHLAIVLHHVYESHDAAGYCIKILQDRGVLNGSALYEFSNHLLD